MDEKARKEVADLILPFFAPDGQIMCTSRTSISEASSQALAYRSPPLPPLTPLNMH
jgi:hypothetical protein